MNRISWLLPVVFLAACGNKEANSPQQPAPPPEVQQAVAQVPPAMPVAAEPVEVCGMLAKEDAEAVLGKLMKDPEAQPAQGSMLGGCNYVSEAGSLAMVSARPAPEYDASVKYSSKDTPPTEVPDLGQKAFDTKAGVMIQPAGKPYFVVVFVAGGSGADKGKTLELAKKLKL